MKKRIPLEYAILAVAVAAAVVAGSAQAQSNADKVARGKYIVTTSGCHDCHTPWVMGEKGPEPDMTRALSGHPQDMVLPPPPKPDGPWIVAAAVTNTAWSGPWGVSYTANLTPDAETGIGKWTLRNFVETIRNGRHMGRGRRCCHRCRYRCIATGPMPTSKRCTATCEPFPQSPTVCPSRYRRPRRLRRSDEQRSDLGSGAPG
jgi:hypothetical protein